MQWSLISILYVVLKLVCCISLTCNCPSGRQGLYFLCYPFISFWILPIGVDAYNPQFYNKQKSRFLPSKPMVQVWKGPGGEWKSQTQPQSTLCRPSYYTLVYGPLHACLDAETGLWGQPPILWSLLYPTVHFSQFSQSSFAFLFFYEFDFC